MEDLPLEQTRFDRARDDARREMDRIDRRFEEGIGAGDEAAEESVRQMLERRYRALLLARRQPFFARIDFAEDGRPRAELYLGKTTVMDENADIRVIDWRAPVASLYYENRLGRASYRCPEGDVPGELVLKRLFSASEERLEGYEDVDITSDDELLRPYLSVSSDARLKNIIATIQAEQNRIIRADLHRHLIVQGVAGSGKTTVALHRVAYFVYTWTGRFTPDRFMILAPGSFFLRLKAPVEDPADGLALLMDESRAGASAEYRRRAYKCSLACRDDLDAFLAEWEKTLLPDTPLMVGGIETLSAAELATLYARQAASLPILTRLGDIKKKLERGLRDQAGGREALRAWLGARLKPSVVELYRRFLGESGPLVWEDLTPLLYLRHRLYGAGDRRCRHIVVDEAQDFSPFTLRLLRELYPNAFFTLFGDLAQAIFPHRGLTDWESLGRLAFDGKADMAVLDKSYRTTVEIMEAAARALRGQPGLSPGRAVVRHGPAVRYETAVAPREHLHLLREALARYAGYRHVAVIAQTQEACEALARSLGDGICLLTGREEEPAAGLCLLTAALSKGLEFDAVVVADAERYGPRDARLLYVAMTRAMHELTVLGLGSLGLLASGGPEGAGM